MKVLSAKSLTGRRESFSAESPASTTASKFHFQIHPGTGNAGILVHQGISSSLFGGEEGTWSGRTGLGGSGNVQPCSGGERFMA